LSLLPFLVFLVVFPFHRFHPFPSVSIRFTLLCSALSALFSSCCCVLHPPPPGLG
jgi:hypothetical protein